ncbi:MAG: hypothetical protein U0237_14550 [Thermoleophilia bacterium]
MPAPNPHPNGDLFAFLRDIERRIRALEGTQRHRVYAAADGARVMIGQLDSSGSVGIRFLNSSGAQVLAQLTT